MKKIAILGCGQLGSIVADAMGTKITSVEGFSGDDHCITMETDGLKVTSDIYSRTAEIAGWSIVSLLQNLASPVVLFCLLSLEKKVGKETFHITQHKRAMPENCIALL